jgi:ACT domain-containing protein
MARKRYKPEEIVAKLRQVDVLVSQGQIMVDAIRQIGVSEATYYRCQIVIESWRRHYNHAPQHPSVDVMEEKRLC